MAEAPESPASGFGLNRRALVRGISGFGLAKLVPGVVGLVTVPLWLRVFGEGPYAAYTIFWVAVNFSSALALGWLRQSILRYTGVGSVSRYGLPYWVLTACVVVAALPMPWLAVVTADGDSTSFMTLVSAAVAFSAANSVYLVDQAFAQSDRRISAYTWAETARASGALVASLLLGMVAGVDAESSMIGGYALATAIAIPIVRRQRAARRRTRAAVSTPDVSRRMRTLWSYGWPMSIWLALAQVLVYFDRLVLAAFIEPEELGAYAAVSDFIVRGVGMAVFPFTMLAHPIIMERWNSGDRAGALKINTRYLLLVAVIALLGVTAVALFGEPILAWVLGVELPDTKAIIALAIGASLWQVALQSHKGLEMQGRTKLMTGLLALICTGTVLALFVVIPVFGTVGSAFVFASGAAFYVLITLIFSKTSMKDESA